MVMCRARSKRGHRCRNSSRHLLPCLTGRRCPSPFIAHPSLSATAPRFPDPRLRHGVKPENTPVHRRNSGRAISVTAEEW